MSDNTFRRKNHYVPELLLKNFSLNRKDARLWEYRLLVEDNNVPEWTLRPISSLAKTSDLYTIAESNDESDQIERWLDEEFESPAAEAVAAAVAGQRLEKHQWRKLARLYAAQFVRTPFYYIRHKDQWHFEMKRRLIQARERLTPLLPTCRDIEGESVVIVSEDGFPLRYTIKREEGLQRSLRVEYVTGRKGSGANWPAASARVFRGHRMQMSRLMSMAELFAGRHFDWEIIILCVRWYLRYLVEMMAERGLHLAHTTIMRWVQRYVPEFEKRWNRYERRVGRSWRMDETYLKVRGRWVYLYRAVDRDGNTVDFRLSPNRDTAAARAFFRKALRRQGCAPVSITLDGYAASHRAVREMQQDRLLPQSTKLRSSKYLNNLIEQDHRGIKSRTRPMLGFKNYDSAVITIGGVELLHRIRKQQFSLGRLRLKGQAAPAIWNAVLAA